jgi:hypothetical protein
MTRELSGTWYNQHGSELVLEVGEDGKLTGSFRSGTGLAVGAGACQVVGFAAQDLVTFAANFGEYGSLTAWTGHLVTEGEPTLHTMWHMTVLMPSRHPERDLWKGVWTGSDVFRRTPQERTVGRVPSHPVPDWP